MKKHASVSLQVEDWPIERVVPYADNPRSNVEAIDKVAASIEKFGWRQPIVVDGDGVVIAGHTRLEAARRLGRKTVPVHVAKGLSPELARTYRIADNRTAQTSTWDWPKLQAELRALTDAGVDLGETAFDPQELERLVAASAIVNDPSGEWSGMPEFLQEDKSAFRSIVVHFKDQAALDDFVAKLGVTLGPKVRYLWYPDVEILVASNFKYRVGETVETQ